MDQDGCSRPARRLGLALRAGGGDRLRRGAKAWAYTAPKAHTAPGVRDSSWPWGPIDRFVLARQEAAGVRPGPDAPPGVWLRRVAFDLVGLPATPEQVAAILRDDSPEARAAVVDRLLASPAFGERWGRHWMDVARFAESSGSDKNFLYPQAWRYRDWVIDAFNADMPYDRFVRLQVAGDLEPATSPAEADAQTIATGFLALVPKAVDERVRELYLLNVADEQIDNIGRGVLGLTVSCTAVTTTSTTRSQRPTTMRWPESSAAARPGTV